MILNKFIGILLPLLVVTTAVKAQSIRAEYFGMLSGSTTTTPVVYDTSATSYINNLQTAGATLTQVQKDSINSFVVQLKAYGYWNGISEAFPMIGGTSATCAIGLKGSYTITWSGTTSFSNLGANVTAGSGSTGILASSLTTGSVTLAAYSQTNITSTNIFFRAQGADPTTSGVQFLFSSGTLYWDSYNETGSTATRTFIAQSSSIGLWVALRSGTAKSIYKNGASITGNTSGVVTGTPPAVPYVIGSAGGGTYSYVSVGGDMGAGTNYTTYSTLINNLQKAFSRNVY